MTLKAEKKNSDLAKAGLAGSLKQMQRFQLPWEITQLGKQINE